MPTFMMYTTGGGKKGRCDANCHNAQRTKCKCACEGAMHGKAAGKSPEEWVKYQEEAADQLFHNMREKVIDNELRSWVYTGPNPWLPM